MSIRISPTAQRISLLILITLLSAFFYTFLHECGHALVGLLSGGSIHTFNINFFNLGAHVGMDVNFTPAQRVTNNLAGTALPLLAWLVFMLAVPRRVNLALDYLKIAVSLSFLNSLLAWIILPMVVFFTGSGPSDDVTNFLRNSGIHPLVVAFTAGLVYTGGWLLFDRQVGGLNRAIDLFRNPSGPVMSDPVRRTLGAMLALAAFFGLAAFALNGFKLSGGSSSRNLPPSDYTLARQIDLSAAEYNQVVVLTFNLRQPDRVGVFLLLEDMVSDLFEVKLTGPNAYETLIIHSEGYTATVDTPRMQADLEPGEYTLLLSSRSSAGKVSIYTAGAPFTIP